MNKMSKEIKNARDTEKDYLVMQKNNYLRQEEFVNKLKESTEEIILRLSELPYIKRHLRDF